MDLINNLSVLKEYNGCHFYTFNVTMVQRLRTNCANSIQPLLRIVIN